MKWKTCLQKLTTPKINERYVLAGSYFFIHISRLLNLSKDNSCIVWYFFNIEAWLFLARLNNTVWIQEHKVFNLNDSLHCTVLTIEPLRHCFEFDCRNSVLIFMNLEASQRNRGEDKPFVRISANWSLEAMNLSRRSRLRTLSCTKW